MKNKKILIGILLLIVIIVIAIIFISVRKPKENLEQEPQNEVELSEYVETLEDGTIKNNSEELKKEKQFGNYTISNIRLTAKENEDATITLNIKNNSQQDQVEKDITLVMKDKEEKEIAQIGLHLVNIEAKGVRTLEIGTIYEVINTYDFEILDQALSIEE